MKSNGSDGKEELRGQESLFREEFGEQMVGKSQPVIVQLDLEDYELKGTAFLCSKISAFELILLIPFFSPQWNS